MNKQLLQQLGVDRLVRGRYQPRRHFDATQLQELADSIKSTGGLLQPIIVRPVAAGQFEIIAGERRWRAAQLAGLTDVSCLVSHYTDEQALQAAIIENINRADLNPIEEAEAYQRLIDEFGYLHEEVAAAVGRSRVAISNALRLLKLDARVQALLVEGVLSESHGKLLAGVAVGEQYSLARASVDKQWSVRRLESEIKKRAASVEDASPYDDANLRHLEMALGDHLGNKVHIECVERGGGVMKIRFSNIDELEGHFARLGFKYES